MPSKKQNPAYWEKNKRFGSLSDAEKAAMLGQVGTSISDAWQSGSRLGQRRKLAAQYQALGGTPEQYNALLPGGGGDLRSGVPAGEDGVGVTGPRRPPQAGDNPYMGYGPGEVNNQIPDWMSKPSDKWDALNQAMIADWVQQQMQAENRKQAQGLLGTGLEDIQSRLVDTPQISQQDIASMTGQYQSQLGMDQGAEMDRIKAQMAARGIRYDPNAGISGAMGGMAGLKRQMGAAQSGRDLNLYANQQNRAALERGLAAREGIRGNIANIGTGFGATPFTMPSPSEVMIMQNPNLLQPNSNNSAAYAQAGGSVLQGVGSLFGGS